MPTISILRGPMATGKSTAYSNLRKHPKMKNWVFVDFPALKRLFENLGDANRKKFGKMVLIATLKEVMKTKRNIITEEFWEQGLKKHLSNYIKKYNYKILTFQFEAELEHTHHRNITRRKARGMKPRPKKEMKESIEIHKTVRNSTGKTIFVNTSELNQKQTVDFIVKSLRRS